MESLRPADPRQIGSYLVLARIGSGGMGEVFLGRSPGGRAVAIKVVQAALATDTKFRARFRREVVAARAVTGAFTAPLIDADPDATQPWLVTAFLPGMSLQDAINGYGPWPPPAVYLLGATLAEALVSIHRAGVVHRDLKPTNILLTPEGPRVIDFGIARAADAATITQTGARVGTPSYMAPEQATGSQIGPPADVHALGAVLTYAATGDPPFTAGSVPQLIYRIVHEQPHLDAITDPGLRVLIAACLEKGPTRRPTAAQLLERLAHSPTGPQGIHGVGWLPPPIASAIADRANLPLPQPSDATEPRALRRRLSRRALIIGGAATAATLATGGTAAALWLNRPSSPVLWKFDVPDNLSVGPVAAGDTVFVAGRETFALDARTGRLRWRTPTRIPPNSPPVAQNGRVFLYDGGSLHGFDEATGRRLWSESIKPLAHGPVPAVMNGIVCMTTERAEGGLIVHALDAATGQPRWQHEANGTFRWMTNAAAQGGVFYCGSGSQLLYAIDEGGRLRWQQSVNRIASTPVIANGVVFVTTDRYEALAFDAVTGKPRWQYATGARPNSEDEGRDVRPVVTGGSVYVRESRTVLSRPRSILHAIDANTGRKLWTFPAGDKASAPVVASGLCVLHDGEGTLHALDADSGKTRWTRRIQTSTGNQPAIVNGAVYVGGDDGVFGLDPPTGRIAFRMDDADFPSESAPPVQRLIAMGGVLYCSVGSKRIYAILA